MYLPKHFEETSQQLLFDLIKAHPLATVVTLSESGLNANHIPLMIAENENGEKVLRGHVARANPILNDIGLSPSTLLVFQGDEHYITPSWYATKKETEKVVPTWNYVVVHVRGKMRVVEDAAWLHKQLNDLTVQQESSRDQPWSLSDAPPEFIEQIKKAIVGFEVQIESLVGKWKVSQNQPQVNRESVAKGLEQLATDSALRMREWVKRQS
ncbi:PaiB family negative transcriptional regulator [Limnobacter thiooxidans]|uniref:FMN-binding negative transcriptional regulator n=1 Tax=Limnobacter thiooxidans TaxID=131080 RepID=A0AA86MED3_9BURK|nr:FMN-binding negative transcriptional regulator [Limnobacter sp.]MCZ8014706.1 FMN-binding negative transcriptional regulator [Limnobacter sp.]RZS40661.1 PaiB family negative transcriptional regulator [Limnobacter thiooxidans]BET26906.1 FMN-binding negative transcriptional regulator [Limnobacter thiooxidans]